MNLEDLLAAPLVPSIRVRLGPHLTLEIDQAAYESKKDALRSFCAGIPDVGSGPSWKVLKAYTGNNGLMAKLLIGVGELLGVWKMYPSPDLPELWVSSLYPMVQAGSLAEVAQTAELPVGVLKPSRGDLEVGKSCECCNRLMGLDLEETESGLCHECAQAGCSVGDYLLEKKAEVPLQLVSKDEEQKEPDDLDDYLKQFG